jgi:hypothetical protein
MMKQGKTVPWLSDNKWVMALAFTVHATKLNEINTYFQSLNLSPHQLIDKPWNTRLDLNLSPT